MFPQSKKRNHLERVVLLRVAVVCFDPFYPHQTTRTTLHICTSMIVLFVNVLYKAKFFYFGNLNHKWGIL